MGINPRSGDKTSHFRPLLKKDIETAQLMTLSGRGAASYLNVSYSTYKKYAKVYGIFDGHRNVTGKGIRRDKVHGKYGLDEILAGKYPAYHVPTLKARLIRVGYLEESCVLCGFNQKRIIDGRCPLVLKTKDGTLNYFPLDNLELLCYNCTYLTTGKVSDKPLVKEGVHDGDILDAGITMDFIEEMQAEILDEL